MAIVKLLRPTYDKSRGVMTNPDPPPATVAADWDNDFPNCYDESEATYNQLIWTATPPDGIDRDHVNFFNDDAVTLVNAVHIYGRSTSGLYSPTKVYVKRRQADLYADTGVNVGTGTLPVASAVLTWTTILLDSLYTASQLQITFGDGAVYSPFNCYDIWFGRPSVSQGCSVMVI